MKQLTVLDRIANMTINFRKLIFCTCLLILGTVSSSAQYIGPGSEVKVHSVAQLLKVGKDNQKVSLQGLLTRQVGPETYIFSDGTGEINARIDEDKFPKQPIDDKFKVGLVGKYDTNLMNSPMIDVDWVVQIGK